MNVGNLRNLRGKFFPGSNTGAVPAMIVDVCTRLQRVESERPRPQVIMATGGVDSGYRARRHAVGDAGYRPCEWET